MSVRNNVHQMFVGVRGIHLRYLLINFACWLMPEMTLSAVRPRLYRLLGVRIGQGASFMHTVRMTGHGAHPYRRLSIGDNTIISTGVLFNLEGSITIGAHVNVSQFVRIYTSRHEMGPSWRRFNPDWQPVPVVIEDGVWIGTGVVILPGVTIGHGSVVSAGSVVNRDVPPNTLVAGVPAAVVRELDP